MRVKIYRKIIRPIIRYAHDEFPPTVKDYWYDDDEIIKEGILSQFEKESDGMSHIEWEEKYVECGEIERGNAWI
jgi:hypothetical protein